MEQDPAFKKIAELLPQAVTEMKAAETKLRAASPNEALTPEQKALRILQQAEEEYEVQIRVGREQGGGGGGGGSQTADDLADLFELELDRMANQYETTQRATQQQADQKLDELMEKLKELARRQEQEAERQRRQRAAGQQQSGGGGGGSQQRALADQAEEAARRLEQLSREENRPELAQSARQLREAADAMRRASANGDPSSGAQASAALERLREAERRLQQSQSGRAERDVKDAQRQADEIAREQSEIAEGVTGLQPDSESRQEQVQQLVGRKEALESKVAEFEKRLDRTAGEIARQERDASRKLTEAAGSIRDNRMRDKIRYSKSMIRAGVAPSDANVFEREIGANIETLRSKVNEAAAALGRSKPDTMTAALDKARELARGMDSLDQRMRERAGRDGTSQNQQRQQGQQGQRGEQGQEGQRGQQGEQGQQGQGGQGGSNDGQRTTDGRGGDGDTTGQLREGGGFGDRRPGQHSRDDVRQFRGEIRQWTNEAQQLRRLIQGQKLDPRQLDEVLKGLRALDDDRVYQDVNELARLQSQVLEGLKRFEYNLRRRADGNQILLSGSDEVPEQFRKLVEQYYRSLSKAPEKRQ
ncbi:MAG: hypothetical protein LC753_04895 [Acidobacteria bacterium]|nr:hypothetical protein [Acidobacteriota bacterium]